jgi:NADH-dependant formate dehydrogenase delta subunit FdsD
VSLAKIDKFARMANQIGDAHAVMPADEGAAGVATHIRKFWTPKMIAETLEALASGRIALNAPASRGFAILKQERARVD